MEIKMKSKLRLFLPCYYAFFANGAMVLLVGVILPYIIAEAGINYSVAGGLLSAFAIGNLLASFVNPVLIGRIGRKATIVILSALIPISFLVITFIPPVWVMYTAFVLAGIGRGSVSIINNAVVGDNSNGKPAALNLLHMTFAFGAFLAPFLASIFIDMMELSWKAIVYAIVVAGSISTAGYALMEIDYNFPKKSEVTGREDRSFMKSVDFYAAGFLLFLYLGVENCVNGWFVTYFKSMGIMNDAYATNLVSVTWVMVMLGRLLTAKISGKMDKNRIILMDCVATAVFFVLLIATKNLAVITVAIAGLGFFFAGIYPTCVSSAHNVIKGSSTGMSMLLAIAALGGIITPKIVGVVADRIGITAAIMLLVVNVAGMLLLAGYRNLGSIRKK